MAEAKRGRRRVRRVWRAPETDAAELTRLAGSPDHQGVVAEVDPYPYADPGRCSRTPRRWSSPSTRSRTRTTSAPSPARPRRPAPSGLVIPSRRSAPVTPAAAKASAGAVEHLPIARVTNLADFLARAKDDGAWIYGAEANAEAPYTQADLTGKVVLVLGSEGKGLRRLVAERCDALISIPVRGRVASLNVSAAAAVAPVRGGAPARAGSRLRAT